MEFPHTEGTSIWGRRGPTDESEHRRSPQKQLGKLVLPLGHPGLDMQTRGRGLWITFLRPPTLTGRDQRRPPLLLTFLPLYRRPPTAPRHKLGWSNLWWGSGGKTATAGKGWGPSGSHEECQSVHSGGKMPMNSKSRSRLPDFPAEKTLD